MSADDKTAEQSLMASLSARMQEVDSLDAIAALLRDVLASRAELGMRNAFYLARSLCSLAIDFEETDPNSIADFIVSHIFPWCELADVPSDVGSHIDLETSRMRDGVRDWIYGYPFEQMTEIRRLVLEETLRRLQSDPKNQHFWLISKIGFKPQEINGFLWRSVDDQGEFADTALSTLIALGPNPDERTRLLDIISAQLDDGRISHAARIAVQEFVGPNRIDIAEKLLSLGVEQCIDDKRGELSIIVSVVTRAVDRCSDDAPVHDRVWNVISGHARIVNMSGEYGFRCSTKRVVVDTTSWLVALRQGQDHDFETYSLLTRLADFVKPEQLSAWDDIRKPELIALVTRLAVEDTKNEGQGATTSTRLKAGSMETLLALGVEDLGPLIEEAVLNETDPYVSNDIAGILSCLTLEQLPESLLARIVSADQIDKTDDQHFFRQHGLIELARVSGSRDALEAMLRFGYLHEGEVLLSTVSTITDLVIARIREGDLEAVDKLVDVATNGQEEHHRNAAASVFCTLCRDGCITGDKLQLLWGFADDPHLHEITRCEALEAIGFTHFDYATAWTDRIRNLAHVGTGDIGWRAWEALVRRQWLTVDDEAQLFPRIGLSDSGGIIRFKSPDLASGWQAFLLGLLYRNDEHRYCMPVADVIRDAKLDVVYQLVGGLRRHGIECTSDVALALVRRIESINNQAMADTGLFDVLAAISPERLLTLSRAANQREWMVEARVALCEAVRSASKANADYHRVASSRLVAFMNDAAFQVRRSAYRALADVSEDLLESICDSWSRSTDVELRKRAAEAAGWLPRDFTDEQLSSFGFAWDEEPAVRLAWKGKILERRRRGWANEYVKRVLQSCRDGNQAVADNHRYARALSKIGDDDSIRQISEFTSHQTVSPSVQNWLGKTVKEIQKQWKQTTAKWPEPWSHECGSIEVVNGFIRLGDGTQLSAKLSLWRQQRLGQSDRYSWGGVAEDIVGLLPLGLGVQPLELVIPGRPTIEILVQELQRSDSNAPRMTFHGNAFYPEAGRVISPGATSGLVDGIARLIRQANTEISVETAESISEHLQPLLARAELPVHGEDDSEMESDHFLLQDVALVVRNVAEHVPATEIGTIALWRIATLMLEQQARTLRLSAREFDDFSRIARSGEEESPDDLLFWLQAQTTKVITEIATADHSS